VKDGPIPVQLFSDKELLPMMNKCVILLLAGILALPSVPGYAGERKLFHHNQALPCPAAWEEKTVTRYRTEQKTRVVPVVTTRLVSKVVEVPYKYTEQVPVTVAEKRTVTTFQCVAKEVPFTYTVKVPVVVPEKRTVTTYTHVPEEIHHQVPVHRLALVKVHDP
jgi:hypothetical protein